jgi:hypothetical protein
MTPRRLARPAPASKALPGAKPVALTRSLPDSSLETWAAEAATQNEALPATHRAMVAQALAHRAAVKLAMEG